MRIASWPAFFALTVGCWFCAAASAGVDVWTPIGPQGAQLGTVITDPATTMRLYTTDANGDIYRSNDAGATWTRITPPQPPSPDCGFWTLVAQGDGAIYASSCHAYKSTDGGVSWV